jgi:hypothetical protein
MNNPTVLADPTDCQTLFDCLKFTVSYGRSGDFATTLNQSLDEHWVFFFAFDLAIRFVLLNVIRGITVDTFSELRIAKLARLRNTLETCFICSINKQIFDRDRKSSGFAAHIKNEHNMWNYVFFIIYIWEQDKDDDDGLEQFVRRSIDTNDITWIPTNRALSLSGDSDENIDLTVDHFQRTIAQLEATVFASVMESQNEIVNQVSDIRENYALSSQSGDDANGLWFAPNTSLGANGSQILRSDSFKGHYPRLVMEIIEISGLDFSSITLQNIVCIVRCADVCVRAPAQHIMPRAHGSSLILFDNLEIEVIKEYRGESIYISDVVSIQLARGVSSGRNELAFMGIVNIGVAELAQADGLTVHKSFDATVHKHTCRGTIVIHPRVSAGVVTRSSSNDTPSS